jgi:C-terminal processing protease CtpA/Prc
MHAATQLAIALSATLAAGTATSQSPVATRDTTIDAAVQARVIDALMRELDRGYVFPEKVEQMSTAVRGRATRGDYGRTLTARSFADSLTAHLQSVTHDKHLRVRFGEPNGGAPRPTAEERERQRSRMLAQAKADNFGIGKPERLDGNVAYLEIRTFGLPPEVIQDAVAEAMSAVADADALILDVRANGGGSPFSVALVSSYLFGPDSVHLNSLYFRPRNQTDHFWTRSSVPGKRFGPTKPLFVLTSRRTFSAAEEFTYNLHSLKRATVVGDTTGGGAHPGGVQALTDRFFVFVPSGRAINPITKTNWEGTGVRPHIAVPSEQAKEAAHRAALRALGKVAM